MNEKTVAKTSRTVEKRAKALKEERRRKYDYTEGSPDELCWENFQLTKGLKRAFRECLKTSKTDASKFYRICTEFFVEYNGDEKSAWDAMRTKIEELKYARPTIKRAVERFKKRKEDEKRLLGL